MRGCCNGKIARKRMAPFQGLMTARWTNIPARRATALIVVSYMLPTYDPTPRHG
jgi:hypothetical protein